MELNRLLLLTLLLLHMKQSRTIPTRMLCDRRVIQKYISEAVEMAEQVSHCEALPLLRQPVLLALVGVNLGDWRQKTTQAKVQEILRDLGTLVDSAAAAQRELGQGCVSLLLQRLYEKASTFALHLQSFGGQEQVANGPLEEAPQLIPERNLRTIFETYKQLVRGKLHLLFADLQSDSCGEDRSWPGAPRPAQRPSSLAISWGQ
ncbi:Thrombopoietin [Varanus komodoensis]|nr:Thrombopoietin [Varanus komodoensis]